MRKGTVLKILDERDGDVWRKYKVVRYVDGDVYLCRCLTGDEQRRSTLWAKNTAEFHTDALDNVPQPYKAVKVISDGDGKELKPKAAKAPQKVFVSWRDALRSELDAVVKGPSGWKGRLDAALACVDFEESQVPSRIVSEPIPVNKKAIRKEEKEKEERRAILQRFASYSTPIAAQKLNLTKVVFKNRVLATELEVGQVMVEASGNWARITKIKKIRGGYLRVRLRRLCAARVVTREKLTNKQLLRVIPVKLVRRYTGKGQI